MKKPTWRQNHAVADARLAPFHGEANRADGRATLPRSCGLSGRPPVWLAALCLLIGLAWPAPAQTNPAPPVILTQPLSRIAAVGDYLMFSVGATGAPPLACQWQFNGTNLPGATNVLLRLGPLGATQAGTYGVVVTNLAGSVTSSTASLTVQPEAAAPWYFTQLYQFTGGTNGAFPIGGLVQAQDGNLYGTGLGGGVPSPGGSPTAFRLTTSGMLTSIHQFSDAAGGPSSALIEGADGNFYGATAVSDFGVPTTRAGSVYEMDTKGVVTTLYSFTGFFDGGYPAAAPIQGGDGNFYGATAMGGSNNIGTLYRLSTNGVLTTLHSFGGGSDGGYPVGPLLLGADAAFYGTTEGTTVGSFANIGYGTVFRLTTNGILTTLYTFAADINGASPKARLVLDGDGNLYGVTSPQQPTTPSSAGSFFRITTNGALTTLYSFSADGSDGAGPSGPLLPATDGSFYGTAETGGPGRYGTVFRMTTNGVMTILYSFTGFANGTGPTGGLTLGFDGNLYGATSGGGVTNTQIISPGDGYGTIYALLAAHPPILTAQPQGQTGSSGQSLTLTVGATSNIPLAYQWQFDGTNIPGANHASLMLPNVGPGASGAYQVVVANLGGSVTSAVASVSVQPAPAWRYVLLHSFSGGDGLNPGAGLTLGGDGGFYGATEGGGANGFGSVFRVTAGGDFSVLYSFTGGADGKTPLAGLTRGTDGNFYGTTSAGGPTNGGAVFVVTTNGALTPLYSFTGAADGEAPRAALTLAGDGAFYGTTYSGGTNSFGTIFRVTANGALTTLYSFSASNLGHSKNALVPGPDGALYGATYPYSPVGLIQGSLFKITTNGLFTTLDSFYQTNSSGGFTFGAPYGGLCLGTDGNFYGTTYFGAEFDFFQPFPPGLSGSVFRMTPGGDITTLYVFTGGSDGGFPQAGLVQGADGNFYGSTSFGGVGLPFQDGTVFQITPEGLFSTLYSFTNGLPYPTPLFKPNPVSALIQASDGSFYGTTTFGGASNQGAIFALIPPSAAAPVISLQPSTPVGLPGGSVTFSTAATGASPLNYQWEFNAAPIPGATNSSLTLTNLDAALAGGYNVIVSNSLGIATSSVARLPFFGLALFPDATNASPVLTLGDIPGSSYRIDVSSDLSSTNNWAALASLTLTNSPVLFPDASGPLSTNRFYRAVLLP